MRLRRSRSDKSTTGIARYSGVKKASFITSYKVVNTLGEAGLIQKHTILVPMLRVGTRVNKSSALDIYHELLIKV